MLTAVAPSKRARPAAAKTAQPPAVVSPDTGRAGATQVRVRAVDGRPGLSLLQQAVDALRRAVLAAPGPGVFLGSEEQLIQALGVSRPTFRQAAKLLRHENLLEIKRGMGGGFFTRSPSSDAVTRMAAIFLNAQGTSMRQINDVVSPLQTTAACLLARNPDRAVRARLRDFLVEQRQAEQAGSGLRPVRRMIAFERLLVELAGNPAISLVMGVIFDLVRDARRVQSLHTPERIAAYDLFQTRLAQAVLEGDAEMAELLCNRHSEESRRWLPDDRIELSMHEPAPSVAATT